MKVKFLEYAQVTNAKNEVEAEFAAGETYDLKDASAQHWISRGKAEAVDEKGNPAQQYMADGAKAPDRKTKGRSADDEKAEKKATENAKAVQSEQAKAEKQPEPDATRRAAPDALNSADMGRPTGDAGRPR